MSTPNSELTIFKGVPLDNTYNKTFTYGNATPFNFLTTNYTYITHGHMMWVKHENGVVRVNIIDSGYPDDYTEYNYLSFINNGRRYFCFINDAKYINDNTVEFEFEIDVLTTYYYDWEFIPCLVEREHSASDGIGDNVEPEPVSLNTYVINSQSNYNMEGDWCVELIWAPKESGIYWNWINGLLVFGATTRLYPNMSNAEILAVLEPHKDDRCIHAYIAIDSATYSNSLYSSTNNVTQSATLDGYTPANKKLYTSPYCVCGVSNERGKEKIYKWEDFSTNNSGMKRANFTMKSSGYGTNSVICYPTFYKNMSEVISECISIDGFGTIMAQSDTIGYWDATHASQNIATVLGSVLTGAVGGAGALGGTVGLLAGAIAGSASGGIGAGLNILANREDTKEQTAGTTGLPASSEHIYSLLNLRGFKIKQYTIRSEVAEKIDTFFSKYGYATNKVKIPNMYSRTKFNYIKTNGCEIKAKSNKGLPAYAAKLICNIHNKGITYWHQTDMSSISNNQITG